MNRKATDSATAKGTHTRVPNNAATASAAALGTRQPSIIIYFSSHHTVMAGYDNVPHPRHIAELPSSSSISAMKMPRSLKSAEIIFQYYSSTIERLIHLLGGGSPNAATASTTTGGSVQKNTSNPHFKNRYIILHDNGIFMNRYWKIAIMRILYDVCNATYLSFLSTIHMIPYSIVSPSTVLLLQDGEGSISSASASTSVVLSVHITRNDAQCMIYANGHHLEYTYQSCEYYAVYETEASEDQNTIVMVDDLRKRQELWFCSSASPLIYAIALCIEKCPVAIRKAAIQNIYFSGTLLVHAFQEKVVLLLYEFLIGDTQVLQSNLHPDNNNSNPSDTEVSSTPTLASDEDVTRTSPNTTMMIQFTQVPINRTMLRPLAPFIAIIENSQRNDAHLDSSKCATELIPWLGVCIYSTYWQHHEHHQEIVGTGRSSTNFSKSIHEGMNWIDVSTTLPNPWNKSE
jgi:hypothetical protein